MKNLPDEYIPEELRQKSNLEKREVIEYAIGYSGDLQGFSMAYGPNEDIMEMLNTVPDWKVLEPCPYIIRFNLDGTDEVLYRWNKNKWTKCS